MSAAHATPTTDELYRLFDADMDVMIAEQSNADGDLGDYGQSDRAVAARAVRRELTLAVMRRTGATARELWYRAYLLHDPALAAEEHNAGGADPDNLDTA